MTDDFVTRLGVALRDAADREERRQAPWRALATARTTLPRLRPGLALATLIAGLIVAAALYGLASFGGDEPAPAGPRVIARLSPAGGLDQIVGAFGSAWMVDTDTHTLLRMDPATRRVTARFPLGGQVSMDPGKNGLWVGVTQSGGPLRLLRIDPGTNRIVARLRTPQPPGGLGFGGPVIVSGNLWLVSAEAVTRIDPRNGHALATVRTAHNGYGTRSLAVVDGDLWVQISDGRVLRLDGATGRRKATYRLPDGNLIGDFRMNGLFVIDQSTVSRMDPRTFRVVWHTPIASIGPGIAAGGRLWVEAPDQQGDRVLTVDPRTGSVIDSVHVGEFGAQWMAPVGSEVWMTTAGGRVIILGR
jgi:DNA-binding beta-propeller fold protein YncE